tara:strand:+ start:2883 stop:4736 length:1854 start_codon:yes stop_codon:yes gene_type:complete
MASKLNISQLDFDQIKGNLKRFLSQQNTFNDYDFEGSGMSVLLDLLAYNTHYLSYNANILANEMFIDTADLRNSIVSLAKALGYTPNSPRSPVADLNIVVNNATGSTLTMPVGTKFSTTVDGQTYNFVTITSNTISPINNIYTFSNVKIYEGTYVTFQYTANTADLDQKFLIQSANADTTTLSVSVQNSASDTTTNTYTKATSITELDSTSKVYFLQEDEDGKFEVYFGDGVIGKKLEDGNIVILKYVVTNKTAANGATTFTLNGNIGGFSDTTITTNSNAANGSEAETNASVKFNAPKSYSAQDRAVTVEDYKVKVQEIYANAKSVSAWGGEDNDTPFYGRVYISIKAKSGSNLTETTKTDIVNQLKKFSIASVTPVILDPETTDIILTSNVKYDEQATTKGTETIKTDITNALTNYNDNTLNQFDGVFRYSKVIELIDDADSSILSNITTVKIRKSFTPTLSTATNYTVSFNNALYNPHSGHNSSAGGILSSTGFKVSGDTTNVYFFDDDGQGNIRRYYLANQVRTYVDNTAGTIDYSAGSLSINSVNITSVENIRGSASSVIECTVTPSSNDVVPVRNQIVNIDVTNSSFTVAADTLVGGSANAGVGYTTTSSY